LLLREESKSLLDSIFKATSEQWMSFKLELIRVFENMLEQTSGSGNLRNYVNGVDADNVPDFLASSVGIQIDSAILPSLMQLYLTDILQCCIQIIHQPLALNAIKVLEKIVANGMVHPVLVGFYS
jgi:hypothetical protein